MATCTALAKIYSTEYFCNTKVPGLGEIFVQQNFHLYSIMLLYNSQEPDGVYIISVQTGSKPTRLSPSSSSDA